MATTIGSEVAAQEAHTYTDEQWGALIEEIEHRLNITNNAKNIPDVDSPAFAKTIDHTLLKLDAQPDQIDDLCSEARRYGFATVCVRPNFVERCVANLKDSDVLVASVIGFHEGTYPLDYKLAETRQSIQAGAAELDAVLNRSDLQKKAYTTAFQELSALRHHAPAPVVLKLILETAHLSRSEIVAACTLAGAAGFDFVKTSTGFDGRGASEEDVRLMSACCEALAARGIGQAKMRVKASGGIRTLANAVAMLTAGASRLGASSGVQIVQQGREGADGSKAAVAVSDGY